MTEFPVSLPKDTLVFLAMKRNLFLPASGVVLSFRSVASRGGVFNADVLSSDGSLGIFSSFRFKPADFFYPTEAQNHQPVRRPSCHVVTWHVIYHLLLLVPPNMLSRCMRRLSCYRCLRQCMAVSCLCVGFLGIRRHGWSICDSLTSYVTSVHMPINSSL